MIFVTGANGFVGKALCKELGSRSIPFCAGTRESYGDFCQQQNWAALVDGVSCIIHLAARVHVMNDNSSDPLQAFREMNVNATLRLARAAKEAGIKKFIFLSSIKVNGEETQLEPFKASDVVHPSDPYGISKKEAEDGLLKLHCPGKFEVVIIRPPLVYGPGVKANFNQLFKIVSMKVPLPFSSVNNKRSFVSLKNLVDLIIHCVDHPKASGRVFLVSDDKDLSFKDLLLLMGEVKNITVVLWPFPIQVLKFFLAIIGKNSYSVRLFNNLQVDISDTKRDLDWKPKYGFTESFNE
jgi:nucleoside-diphosphate-sugar epimerase